jgi:hypothetical protein
MNQQQEIPQVNLGMVWKHLWIGTKMFGEHQLNLFDDKFIKEISSKIHLIGIIICKFCLWRCM